MKWMSIGLGVGLTAIGCGIAVANGGDPKVFGVIPAVAFFLGLFASLSD